MNFNTKVSSLFAAFNESVRSTPTSPTTLLTQGLDTTHYSLSNWYHFNT